MKQTTVQLLKNSVEDSIRNIDAQIKELSELRQRFLAAQEDLKTLKGEQ